ncbi:glycosyltransferase family 39 protein [Hydromonas duriensis]|uniref:Dolichyl-phosphate-mannose-protein mannosyltransferase n=1 Tax=Hydromonas duriensis TaxID=1527608 RepID=A0A4R6YAG4_9BURK|nr:glycosyltransferase family 39 protein [Hydromonas duriensis]TDR32548.1 dolichyl-phosphate-mannose-protein mannosyltransferase [Hydromonas duriensis]
MNNLVPRRPTWPYLILIHVLLWWLVTSLFNRGLDNYGDMVENYAWAQSMDWGTFKHPPLVAWIVHAWFMWMPTTVWSYYLLAWLNVGLTLWGIAALAKIFALNASLSNSPLRSNETVADIQWTAVAFGSLLFPLSTLASKYNANAVLLPFWVWATVFLLKSWLEKGWRGILSTVALALFAALGMLGKYYTGVLLFGFFIASLLHPVGRRWYRSSKPYVSLVLFLIFLMPHLQWVKAHDYITFKYAEEQGDGHVSIKHLISFAASYYYYAVLLWLAAFICLLRPDSEHNSKQSIANITKSVSMFFKTTFPRASDGLLCLAFALLPMLISIAFAITGFVELTAHWAIPIWYALPILAIAKRQRPMDSITLAQLWRVMLCIWTLVALVGAGRGVLVNTPYGQISIPRETLANAIAQDPNTQHIGWVSGMWQEAASLAYFMDAKNANHPRALPTTPDSKDALLNPLKDWQHMNGLIVCVLLPAKYAAPADYLACKSNTETWLQAHQSNIDKKTFNVPAPAWFGTSVATLTATVYYYHAQ